MSEEKGTITKTIGALSAVGKILSFLEKAFIGAVFMVLEFTRIKKRKAEVRADKAETELKIREKYDKVYENISDKSDVNIIDDMFAEDSNSDRKS